jgi:hypothetical protein
MIGIELVAQMVRAVVGNEYDRLADGQSLVGLQDCRVPVRCE